MRLYIVVSFGALIRVPDESSVTDLLHAEVYSDRALAASTWRDWCVECEAKPSIRAEVERMSVTYRENESVMTLLWVGDPELPGILGMCALLQTEASNLRLVWEARP